LQIFFQNAPKGLLYLKGAEYQIDFIFVSSFPSKLDYITNLEESKEIQKQVEGLYEKDCVQDNMSLCVKQIFLIPKMDGSCHMCTKCHVTNTTTIKYR